MIQLILIEIFGAGCEACHHLERNVREAVAEMGIDAKINVIRDIDEMIRRGVLFPPALYIDGVRQCAGHVPAKDEVRKILEYMKK